MKSRSQAIKTALNRYNAAAANLNPPAPSLEWEDVVEYSFLSDFDILRDSRQDVRSKPWARPAARVIMERYFKLQRAREEITRLNVEIRRLVAFIRDEGRFLDQHIVRLEKENPELAHHVAAYRSERCRSNATHIQRLKRLASLDGFTGSIDLPRVTLTSPPPKQGEPMEVGGDGNGDSENDSECSEDEDTDIDGDGEGPAEAVHRIYRVFADTDAAVLDKE